MSKYIVQAVQREGFRGVWRAGREWPHTPIEVEVLDQDEDPTVEVTDPDGKKRQALHSNRVGRKSWAAMMADGRISKTAVETKKVAEVEGELGHLRVRVKELEAELSEARAEIAAMKAVAPEVPAQSISPEMASEERAGPPTARAGSQATMSPDSGTALHTDPKRHQRK